MAPTLMFFRFLMVRGGQVVCREVGVLVRYVMSVIMSVCKLFMFRDAHNEKSSNRLFTLEVV